MGGAGLRGARTERRCGRMGCSPSSKSETGPWTWGGSLMPCISGQYGPAVGVLLQVAVLPGGHLNQAIRSNSEKPSIGVMGAPVSGLLDTGADHTCVSRRLAQSLDLRPCIPGLNRAANSARFVTPVLQVSDIAREIRGVASTSSIRRRRRPERRSLRSRRPGNRLVFQGVGPCERNSRERGARNSRRNADRRSPVAHDDVKERRERRRLWSSFRHKSSPVAPCFAMCRRTPPPSPPCRQPAAGAGRITG